MTTIIKKTFAADFARFLLTAYDYVDDHKMNNRQCLHGVRIEIEESGRCIIAATDARAMYHAECQIETDNIPPGGVNAIVDLKPVLPALRKAAKQNFGNVKLMSTPDCIAGETEKLATSLCFEIDKIKIIVASMFAYYVRYVTIKNLIPETSKYSDNYICCNLTGLGIIAKQLKYNENDTPVKIGKDFYRLSFLKGVKNFDDATVYHAESMPLLIKYEQYESAKEKIIVMPSLIGKKSKDGKTPYLDFCIFDK